MKDPGNEQKERIWHQNDENVLVPEGKTPHYQLYKVINKSVWTYDGELCGRSSSQT